MSLSSSFDVSTFCSDKILHELAIRLATSGGGGGISSNSNAYYLKHAVHHRKHGHYRKGELEKIASDREHNQLKQLHEHSLDRLSELFKEFFVKNGSFIYAKPKLSEEYSNLIQFIDPSLVLGYHLADSLYSKRMSRQDISAILQHYPTYGLKRKSLAKKYAENHLHLFGVTGFHVQPLLLLTKKTPDEFYKVESLEYPDHSVFALVREGVMSFGKVIDMMKMSFHHMFAETGYRHKWGCRCEECSSPDKDKEKQSLHTFRRLILHEEPYHMLESNIKPASFGLLFKRTNNDFEFILKKSFEKWNSDPEQAWVYLLTAFFLWEKKDCDKNNHKGVEKRHKKYFVRIFIHALHLIRSYSVMSNNKGLSHFVDFYDSPVREQQDKKEAAIQASQTIFRSGTTHLEAKVTSKYFTNNQNKDKNKSCGRLIYNFEKSIEEEKQKNPAIDHRQHDRFFDHREGNFKTSFGYQFSCHFIRTSEKGSSGIRFNTFPEIPCRFYQKRKSLLNEANKLNEVLEKPYLLRTDQFNWLLKHGTSEEKFNAYQKEDSLRNKKLYLGNSLVSLDVAGDEVTTPVEVFAPVVRYLRRDNIPLKDPTQKKKRHHKRLRLSIHAGEDFDHLLTGMRKVDETVEFCDYRPKDRLGHALAIGVDPKEWALNKQEVVTDQHTWLDNLVWLRCKVSEIAAGKKDMNKWISYLDRKISKYAKCIYGNVIDDRYNLSPDTLYKAWKLRGNSFLYWKKNIKNWGDLERFKAFIPDLEDERHVSNELKGEFKLYKLYHTNRTVREQGEKTLLISNKETSLDRYEEQLPNGFSQLLKVIQDYQIRKYAEKGIIIETNPSSNKVISKMKGLGKHPIFRWSPPQPEDGTPVIQVCVNTDDPAIFPTTLQHEYQQLENAAKQSHNIPPHVAREWIKKLRKDSLEVFMSNYQNILSIDG